MVVFTCQHCNASLKRVAVAKHYFQACRRTPYLTCIDCLKDFHGDDYNSHMTCVTEDERYGDKNFVAKKMGVKQTEWIDIVHMCAQKNENPQFNSLFSKLASYQNVPRKKNKFLNFVKSSLSIFSQDIAVEVFQIIEEQFLKQKKKDSQVENNISKNVKNTDETLSDTKEVLKSDEKKMKKKQKQNSESETLPTEHTDVKVATEEKSNKKKKNKIKDADKLLEAESQELEESADMTKLPSVRVKNKNKQKNGFLNETSEEVEGIENASTDNQNGTESHEEANVTDIYGKLSKKELKKLKKKEKYEAELKNIEESGSKDMEHDNEADDQESKKPTKKKKRKVTVSEIESATGKRQKVEGNESENFLVENNVEEEEKPKGKVNFNWEEIIKEVLRKSPDHEMSLKRISKKVLAEYQVVKGDKETYEELISKFNKKINKTVGVRVLKDKAKLISEN